jgi:hypothetical protein
MICKICDSANWDGINPHHDEKLEKHLKGEGIPIPDKNEKGFYPLPPRGH